MNVKRPTSPSMHHLEPTVVDIVFVRTHDTANVTTYGQLTLFCDMVVNSTTESNLFMLFCLLANFLK